MGVTQALQPSVNFVSESAARQTEGISPRVPSLTAVDRASARSTASQERFELKYWVRETSTRTVADVAQGFLRVDPYQAKHGQRVTSLYLDTPTQQFYRAHVDESPDRVKLRVRVYGDTLRGPAFFELKRKVKSVIVKRRAAVPLEDVARILDGDHRALHTLPGEQDRKSLHAFLYFMLIQHAEPTFLVTCRREAYASAFEDDVRVTIDRDIAYQPALGARLDGNPKGYIAVKSPAGARAEPMALVELKFRGLAPLWMERLVRSLQMRQVAFSKYVSAVTHELEERPANPELTPSMWI